MQAIEKNFIREFFSKKNLERNLFCFGFSFYWNSVSLFAASLFPRQCGMDGFKGFLQSLTVSARSMYKLKERFLECWE